MEPKKAGALGRWLAVYLTMNLSLWVAFSLLVREDIVQDVLNDHVTLFALTCAAISLLVTTLVDDALDAAKDKGESE